MKKLITTWPTYLNVDDTTWEMSMRCWRVLRGLGHTHACVFANGGMDTQVDERFKARVGQLRDEGFDIAATCLPHSHLGPEKYAELADPRKQPDFWLDYLARQATDANAFRLNSDDATIVDLESWTDKRAKADGDPDGYWLAATNKCKQVRDAWQSHNAGVPVYFYREAEIDPNVKPGVGECMMPTAYYLDAPERFEKALGVGSDLRGHAVAVSPVYVGNKQWVTLPDMGTVRECGRVLRSRGIERVWVYPGPLLGTQTAFASQDEYFNYYCAVWQALKDGMTCGRTDAAGQLLVDDAA